jgi:8-oxo-dGTP pyrophosphatase MutT (NUDIX family)
MPAMHPPWHALQVANAQREARVPFFIEDRPVGSVAAAHLPALQRWPHWLRVGGEGVTMPLAAGAREPAFEMINRQLHHLGLIRAWRDETFPVLDLDSGALLARFERAASRFWGTLTLGAHATGYVAGPDGRPAHLWIAQRSFTKPTDPGLYDNLIGGGVPDGQTPQQALVREGWEEAGLTPAQMAGIRPGRVMRLRRDIPEGLQLEDVHGFDLELPAGLAPSNQDGEVAGFRLMAVADALALAAGDTMTVDAALVTLDFALRHGLLERAPEAAEALFVRR